MKKIYIAIICIFVVFAATSIFLIDKKDSTLKKVTIAEVTHSIFYAPQYVALEKGYFKEVGLDANLILTPGADKVTAAVLSGDADFGFAGSEASIYVYNGNEKDYIVNFAAMTKRDGSFIVSRKDIKDFKVSDLKGSSIVGGRKGGMPEMTLEWAIRQNGLDPVKDVSIDTSIEFAAMSGAFIGGTGDFVTLFEPNALTLEKQGYGHVVASVGELAGEVPYTVYNARKSYIENNKDTVQQFTNAIYKGLQFVKNNSSEEIAKVIYKQFPDTSMNDLVKIVDRYKASDSWYENPIIKEDAFDHIQEIMTAANSLEKKAPFDALVDNSFAEAVK